MDEAAAARTGIEAVLAVVVVVEGVPVRHRAEIVAIGQAARRAATND